METLSEAMKRLTAHGYRDQFRVEGEQLRSSRDGSAFAPERLCADAEVRFEGASDPADSAVLFALSSDDGRVLGTYCVAFGPSLAPDDADMVRRLQAASPRDRARTADSLY